MADHQTHGGNTVPDYPFGKPDILINIVDYRAKRSPRALYAEFPVSATSYDAGYKKVTYADLANAINGVAWWLERTLGKSKTFETLAYMGPNDLRYNVLILGAVKAGYKMLLTSPRNSIPAHVNLFNLLDCSVMLAPNPQPPIVPVLAAAHELRVIEVPNLDELLEQRYPYFPYIKTFEEASHEPLIAFHTSGSTGLPKPLVWSHAFAAAYVKMTQLDPPFGYESQDRLFQGNRLFFMMPPFHAANHCISLCNAINNRTSIIYPLPGAIPTAQLMADALKQTTADVAFVPPSVVAEVGKNPTLLEFFARNLDTLLYVGGDVPQVLGNPVTCKMQLANIYGASEMGVPPAIRPGGSWPSDNWKYVEFHPEAGVEFEHSSEDLYQLCIARKVEFESYQPVFKLYPHLNRFHSGDLFSSHPTKPGLWIHRGRADDIIVFLTGEKTNPTSMEEHINGHSEVRAALVIGAQRFQAALLIELATDKALTLTERAEAIERIWPTIQEANEQCPAHAKIAKSHILFVHPEKPMQRSGKGTVQRRPTIELYVEETEALYADAEKIAVSTSPSMEGSVRAQDAETLPSLIHEAIGNITGWHTFENEDNLFLLGMDSLQALLLTRSLKQELANAEIAVSTVYANPTVVSLVKALLELSVQGRHLQSASLQTRQRVIESTLEKHKNSIDEIADCVQRKRSVMSGNPRTGEKAETEEHTVILTGSTGALGVYLLQVLLEDPCVSHVYCLNRASNSSSLQSQRNIARKLPAEFPPSRVTFLTADISQRDFGLDHEKYLSLLVQTTAIIHNAWTVNFNLPLSAFSPQFVGITRLVDFTVSAAHSPTLFFISSVSSTLGYRGNSPTIHEDIISDVTAPSSMGYGESKYVAELLLDYGAKRLPIDARVARVGQVAGPVKSQGTWNKREWLPSLVLSSLQVGALPESLGVSQDNIDWVPGDILAEVLVDLTLKNIQRDPSSLEQLKENGKVQVFHVLNPHPITWNVLLPTIVDTLNRSNAGSTGLKIVPFQAWLEKVRADAQRAGGTDVEAMLKANPAVKLLSFYEKLAEGEKTPKLETLKTEEFSAKMQAIGEVKPEWMERWIEGWLLEDEE